MTNKKPTMNLPTVSTPVYDLVIPSTGEKIKYRPFKVKEEKIFLMAMENKDITEIVNSLRVVINSCTFNSIDIGRLPNFDLEYIFLQLRAKSVNQFIDFEITGENDDNVQIPVKIDINDIKIVHSEEHNKVVMLDDNLGITLRYPLFEDTQAYMSMESEREAGWEVIKDCIDTIFTEDSVISADDINNEQLDEWVEENLDKRSIEQINKFFNTMPKLSYTLKYEDPTVEGDGKNKEMKLEGLEAFFTLG